MANPFFIQPASYGAGLASLGQQIGQLGQQYKQENREDQAQEKQAATMQKARDLFAGNASPQEIAMFSLENPEVGKALMSGMQFKSEATKENLMQTYQAIVSGGDVVSALESRAKFLVSQGADSADTIEEIEQYKADPEGYVEQKKNQYMLLDKDYADLVSKQTPEPMTEYQGLTIQGKKIDQQLRKEESLIKRDEIKLKRETDLLKKQELQDKIQVKKDNIEKAKVAKVQKDEDSITSVQTTVDTIDRLLAHPGLESASGFQANFPTLSGTDASNFELELETLQSQSFLSAINQMKGMGALSENEGKKLSGSIGAMSIDMGDKALKKELSRIKETLEIAMVKMRNRMPNAPKKAETTQEEAEQQTPDGTVIKNPSTGEVMIMQGGEWVHQEQQTKPTATYRGY
jgi:hypothetical protein